MSWSVGIIGTSEKIVTALDEQESRLSGQSLEEYKEAKPIIQSLLKLNVNQVSLFQLNASGHASFEKGVKTSGYVVVDIKQLYVTIAI